jgi:hypothetical protein
VGDTPGATTGDPAKGPTRRPPLYISGDPPSDHPQSTKINTPTRSDPPNTLKIRRWFRIFRRQKSSLYKTLVLGRFWGPTNPSKNWNSALRSMIRNLAVRRRRSPPPSLERILNDYKESPWSHASGRKCTEGGEKSSVIFWAPARQSPDPPWYTGRYPWGIPRGLPQGIPQGVPQETPRVCLGGSPVRPPNINQDQDPDKIRPTKPTQN